MIFKALPAGEVLLAHAEGHAVLSAGHPAALLCILNKSNHQNHLGEIILKLIMTSLEPSRGRRCLHNCVLVDLVKSISLDRLKSPGTLTGGGSGGQGKA